MLLHKKTRDQLEINIRDSVIIIDEAHNLLDTIASIHSTEVSCNHFQAAHRHLSAYKAKYSTRFSSKSLLRINQLIAIIHRFTKLLNEPDKSDPSREFQSKMIFVHELLDNANISVGTLFEILLFCENTKLASKLCGFVARFGEDIEALTRKEDVKPKAKVTHTSYLKQLAEKKAGNAPAPAKSTPAATEVERGERDGPGFNSSIRLVLTFLECLVEKSTDGRVLVSKHRSLHSKSFLKYLLLNPSGPFEALVRECRSVVIAGGTMQPTDEFKSQLFQGFADRIEEHFFGHVVDQSSVLPLVVRKGPRGSGFHFNFAHRENREMVRSSLVFYLSIIHRDSLRNHFLSKVNRELFSVVFDGQVVSVHRVDRLAQSRLQIG